MRVVICCFSTKSDTIHSVDARCQDLTLVHPGALRQFPEPVPGQWGLSAVVHRIIH